MYRSIRLLVVLLGASGVVLPSHAQTYPSKPVRVIVPFPPGGGADIVMRAIGLRAADGLKQQVLIDNRAGASGLIGAELAARAPADGYTLVLATTSNFSINPHLAAQGTYQPISDFSPVTLLATAPLMLAVHPSLPARDVKTLIALARARPGDLLYGTNGAGSLSHLATVLFSHQAGIEMLHVPYKGGTPAVTDTVAGHVAVIVTAIPTLQAQVRAGRLRALALTGATRSVLAPELPTVAESGLPGFEVVQWYGLFGPARVAVEVVTKLEQEFSRAARTAGVAEVLFRDGAEARGESAQALAKLVRTDFDKWGKVVREHGIR